MRRTRVAAAWNLVAEQVLLLLVGLEDRLHEPQESLLLQAATLFSDPPTHMCDRDIL